MAQCRRARMGGMVYVPSMLGDWFSRHKRRIGLVVVGHAAKRVEEYLFDWLLYGAIVLWSTTTFGAFQGSLIAFAIMAPVSALLCWLYMLLYDWAKKDIFGFEMLKELRDEESHGGFIGRLLRKVLSRGDAAAFIALSIYGDPFLVTVYLRKKEHTHRGLTRRDWSIFWGAVLFSNGYWTLRWAVIFELFRILFGVFTSTP